MTTEEKAKAYDEALKEAVIAHKDEDRHLKATLERIFPELAESEDERTRKEILNVFKQLGKDTTLCGRNYDYDKWIAWLEKQGDKDKLIKELGEYKVKYTQEVLSQQLEKQGGCEPVEGEWPYTNPASTLDGEIENIWNNLSRDNLFTASKTGFSEVIHHFINWLEKQGEQKPNTCEQKPNPYSGTSFEYNGHTWGMCARDGDVLQLGTVTAIFKKYIGQEKCICYCSIDENGVFEIPIEDGEDNIYGCTNTTPATKEQRDLLFQKMNEAGYEWDADKKELKKPHRIISAEAKEALYDKPAAIDIDKMVDDYANNEELNNEEFGKPLNCMIRAYRQGLKDAIGKVVSESAWSEDDETGWTNTMIMIKEVASNHYTKDSVKLVIDWLKSIKQRIKGE